MSWQEKFFRLAYYLLCVYCVLFALGIIVAIGFLLTSLSMML